MVKLNLAAVAAALLCAATVAACGDDAPANGPATPTPNAKEIPPDCVHDARCGEWMTELQGPCHQRAFCFKTVNQFGTATGVCKIDAMKVAGSETPCDDGNACTQKDVCTGNIGACAGVTRNCDDKNSCTDDSCDPKKGCVYLPQQVSCTDGDNCTTNDLCKGGVCVGDKIACDDNNPCTSDSCEKAKGCVNANNANPCDDNNKCTESDVCKDGACAAGKLKVCEDQNPCTEDLCEASVGCAPKAKTDGVICSDADPSTADDVCKSGTCVGESIYSCVTDADCAENIVAKCGTPTCLTNADGVKKCKIVDKSNKDDGNPCTEDSCNPEVGIEHAPLSGDACQDGNICTVNDICTTGVCVPGKPFSCDDGNACTADACDSSKGCVHTTVAIDDMNPYTDDSCDPKFGPQHIPQKLLATCVIPAGFIEGVEVKDCVVEAKYGKLTGGKKTYSDPVIGDAGLELLLEKVCGKLAAGNVLLLSATASMPDGKPVSAGGEVITVTAPGGALVNGSVQEWSAVEPDRVITSQDLAQWCK